MFFHGIQHASHFDWTVLSLLLLRFLLYGRTYKFALQYAQTQGSHC